MPVAIGVLDEDVGFVGMGTYIVSICCRANSLELHIDNLCYNIRHNPFALLVMRRFRL